MPAQSCKVARRLLQRSGDLPIAILMTALLGCGSSKSPQTPAAAPAPATPAAVNNYIGTYGSGTTQFSIDTLTSLSSNGPFTRILGFLEFTQARTYAGSGPGYAVEIPGSALLLRPGDATTPLTVATTATQCPVMSTPTEFEFITMPADGKAIAFGTISALSNSNGSSTAFSAQNQTVATGSLNQQNLYQKSFAGTCGQSQGGGVITVPETVDFQYVSTIGIGPAGFFFDDQSAPTANQSLVGFQVPLAPVNVENVVAGNYVGFLVTNGLLGANSASVINFDTHPVVFRQTAGNGRTAIAGGILAEDAGLTAPALLNLVVDLGPQDPQTNGLFPSATVTYPATLCPAVDVAGTDVAGGPTCTYPAAAIVGTPGGKFAIYVVAETNRITGTSNQTGLFLFQQ